MSKGVWVEQSAAHDTPILSGEMTMDEFSMTRQLDEVPRAQVTRKFEREQWSHFRRIGKAASSPHRWLQEEDLQYNHAALGEVNVRLLQAVSFCRLISYKSLMHDLSFRSPFQRRHCTANVSDWSGKLKDGSTGAFLKEALRVIAFVSAAQHGFMLTAAALPPRSRQNPDLPAGKADDEFFDLASDLGYEFAWNQRFEFWQIQLDLVYAYSPTTQRRAED